MQLKINNLYYSNFRESSRFRIGNSPNITIQFDSDSEEESFNAAYILPNAFYIAKYGTVVFYAKHNFIHFQECFKAKDNKLIKKLLFPEFLYSYYKKKNYFKKLGRLPSKKIENKIEAVADQFDWSALSSTCIIKKLSFSFIENFIEEWNWEIMSYNPCVTHEFIDRFRQYLSWEILIQKHQFSEEELEKYYKHYDLKPVLFHYKLTEDFINKHIEDIENLNCWNIISRNQNLSEDFIRTHKKKLNWEGISQCQIMSLDFIEEFRHYIFKDYLLKNDKVPDSIKFKVSDILTRSHMESHE